MRKHYAIAYAWIAALVLLGGLVPTVLSALSGRFYAAPIIVAVILAVVLPPLFIWVGQKMGYPIGRPVHCTRCQTEVPMFRKPRNMRQALWGGYDCPNCGAHLDARGRELTAR